MGLLEDLLGRPIPTRDVRLVLDHTAHTAAVRQLDAASQALALAEARGELDLAAERAALQAAEEALAAVPTRTITLAALSPLRWNELLREHPPPDGDKTRIFDAATLRPAMLAESVIPADGEQRLTVAQWQQIEASGRVTNGELDLLFAAALDLNGSAPQLSVGKG